MIATFQIERALIYADGSHTLADIEAAVAKGDMQLWKGEESAIITEIKQTPQQRGILFFLAGGNLRELQAMAPPILEWAKRQGCTKAEFIGRFGWQRTWLAKDGWYPRAVMMERDL